MIMLWLGGIKIPWTDPAIVTDVAVDPGDELPFGELSGEQALCRLTNLARCHGRVSARIGEQISDPCDRTGPL